MTSSAAADDLPATLVAYAERRIKADIASGKVKSGDRLSPHLLAPEFGLSHIPIREALSSLSAAGYVIHKRGKGYFARELSSDDLADIYHWRSVLEREALLLAVPKMTDDDIAEMARLVSRMEPLTGPEKRVDFLELNREFHFVAFRRSGSSRLVHFLNYLWDNAQPYATLGKIDSVQNQREHLELIPLFAAHDTEAVIAKMNQHRERRVEHVAEWEAAHAHQSVTVRQA
jgi:DNA-binding GntR family transcriptional regulator